MIVGRFVLAYSTPVNRFSNYAGGLELLNHPTVPFLRVREFLLHEVNARDGHFQTRLEPILRQITLDSVALTAVRIHDQDCRRPERLEPFEPRGMFFDVSFERDESLMNEVCDFLIRVGFGFQPSACASGRRG